MGKSRVGRDMLKKIGEETMTAMHRFLEMARADHVMEIGGRYIHIYMLLTVTQGGYVKVMQRQDLLRAQMHMAIACDTFNEAGRRTLINNS